MSSLDNKQRHSNSEDKNCTEERRKVKWERDRHRRQ